MFLTASFVIISYIGLIGPLADKIGKADHYVEHFVPLVEDKETRDADKIRLEQMRTQLVGLSPPSSASSAGPAAATTQAVAGLLSWSVQNVTAVTGCVADFNSGVGCAQMNNISNMVQQALQAELNRIVQYETLRADIQILETYIKEDEDYIRWWIDRGNAMIVISLVVYTVTTLVALWFVWVGKLAYRKKLLELALSSVKYDFDPKVMNGTRDTKFVAYFFCSIVLGYFLATIVLLVVGFILCVPEVWEFIFVDHLSAFISWCVYMATTIIVVPMVHAKLVLKDGVLARPYLQSSLIFVWELFYAPKTAFSVVLKAIHCLWMSVVNFLRPDAPLLPHGFAWLDSLHAGYVASVYAQMDAAFRNTPHGKPAVEDWLEEAVDEPKPATSGEKVAPALEQPAWKAPPELPQAIDNAEEINLTTV
jgi:hypothetical protein